MLINGMNLSSPKFSFLIMKIVLRSVDDEEQEERQIRDIESGQRNVSLYHHNGQ